MIRPIAPIQLPSRKILAPLLVLLWIHLPAVATTLAPAFGDHMVLQRGRPVPVFGSDTPGQVVTVSFAGHRVQAEADADGRWKATLPALSAHPGGRSLSVNGSSSLEIQDVAVGEVWIAAGQSNMDWSLRKTGASFQPAPNIRMANWTQSVATPAGKVYGSAEFAKLTPEHFYTGSWQPLTRENQADQSAVAAYFAQHLARGLAGKGPGGMDIPIGILEMAIGGTTTEAFIPPTVLRADPLLRPLFEDPRHVRTLGRWARGRIGENLKGYVHDDSSLPHPHPYAPGFLYQTGVARLAPFAARGVIWYQGESNANFSLAPNRMNGARVQAFQEHVLTQLIQSWRTVFAQPGLPFYMVQLPRIQDPERSVWPWYREAQRQVANRLPGVELAVLPEVGDGNANVHPPRKEPVGRRLANIALNQCYGQPISFRSPQPQRITPIPGAIQIEFGSETGSLQSYDRHGIREFEVAGADRIFHPALARIEGSTIQVYAPEVSAPIAVRHGWDMNLDVNLATADGFRVGPFRTDNWLVSPGRKIRVACIGDSITEGAGLMDPDVNSYPAQLQHQLDPALFDVQNFGHSGTGLVRPGRLYLDSPRHRAALDWQPDVVICNLGINDMTMGDALQREVFLKNYRSLIDAYADLPTAPVIVLWSPLSPVLPGLASYSQPLRQRAIEEWIQDVAARTGSLTLDMQAGLVDHPEWYPDRLHPNAEGARFIAEKTAAFLHNLSL